MSGREAGEAILERAIKAACVLQEQIIALRALASPEKAAPTPPAAGDLGGVWTDEIWLEHVRKTVARLRSPTSNATGLRVSNDHYLWLADKVLNPVLGAEPLTTGYRKSSEVESESGVGRTVGANPATGANLAASDLRERAKEAYARLNHLYGDRAIRQMARILAEAKAEGWEDAVKALREMWRKRTWDSDCWIADWLAANRPLPTGRES